jgi:hypothetical protein
MARLADDAPAGVSYPSAKEKPNMNLVTARAFAAAFVLMISMADVPAADIAGVRLADKIQLGNTELLLNGAGVRYKGIFQVYVAALYVPSRKSTTTDVLAAQGARRVTLVMLRDVSSNELGRAFMSGIHENTPKVEAGRLMGQLVKFGEMFGSVAALKKGDTLTVDWIPTVGTVAQLNGRALAEPVQDIAFYNVVLRIWLGDRPADVRLKRAMLGEVEPPPTAY